jgi:retinol dehydrogenase 12
MNNKIVLITGATSGIGKVAATELAKMGATVIIHGRNREKAEIVKQEIVKICGHDRIDILLGDMSSLNEVRALAEEFLKKYDRLDVLVNNAGGVMGGQRQLTADGLEKTFAVNVAALFLLTSLLFNHLRKSDDGRIINVSSMAHKFGKLQIEDLQSEKKYTSSRAYGNAKLHVIAITEELDRRMKKNGISNVSINALHPGVVATNFARDSKGSMMRFFFRTFGFLFISPEKGAKTTIFLASSENTKGVSGIYFSKCRPAKIKRTYLSNDSHVKSLWDYLEKTCRTEFPA